MVGIILFCSIILRFLKLKKINKDNLHSGFIETVAHEEGTKETKFKPTSFILGIGLFIGFLATGFLFCILLGLYETWTNNDLAIILFSWINGIFGLVAFYIFIFPYLQKESKAMENY